MLIRNQDKKQLINMANVTNIFACNNQIIAEFLNDSGYATLGKYSTEEKAIKVLDMIQNSYQYVEECRTTGVGCSQPEFVFQMPADSEV